MISGIIEDWGIDFLSPEFNRCICGEIYNSPKFKQGKFIYTSMIDNVYIENNYLSNDPEEKQLIFIKTTNGSIYILGTMSSNFNDYLKFMVDQEKLYNKIYSLDNSLGISNIIKWYLKYIENLNEVKKLD